MRYTRLLKPIRIFGGKPHDLLGTGASERKRDVILGILVDACGAQNNSVFALMKPDIVQMHVLRRPVITVFTLSDTFAVDIQRNCRLIGVDANLGGLACPLCIALTA